MEDEVLDAGNLGNNVFEPGEILDIASTTSRTRSQTSSSTSSSMSRTTSSVLDFEDEVHYVEDLALDVRASSWTRF